MVERAAVDPSDRGPVRELIHCSSQVGSGCRHLLDDCRQPPRGAVEAVVGTPGRPRLRRECRLSYQVRRASAGIYEMSFCYARKAAEFSVAQIGDGACILVPNGEAVE